MNCADTTYMNTLQLSGLTKLYGHQAAVENLDLSLGAGESLAIIGHNGAGKTTLMKLILGLTRPSAGKIERWACAAGTRTVVASDDAIGFLPESVAFPGTISGQQMLRFYARLKGASRRQCDDLLDLVGLADAAGQRINTYSKGMRQRLGLAQALLGSPDLLLLDEPTSGLDPFLRSHFYDIIRARQTAGTSVIISSHALTEIEARTDRIAIMKQGRLLEQGSLASLRSKAALPVRIAVSCHSGGEDKLRTALPAACPLERVTPDKLVLSCAEEDKLNLLHLITGLQDAVKDVAVRPPRLDDLYAHFVNGDRE